MDLKTIREKLKNAGANKKMRLPAIVLIIAVILLICVSSFTGKGEKKEAGINDGIEKRLEQAICEMRGVSGAKVVINYESSGEKIPALKKDTVISGDGSEQREEVTTVSGEALILKEREPEVRGVIVVADGAEDIGVRQSIISAVTTLLDIPADKVEILY